MADRPWLPRALLLDMDGVLYHGDRALPGAAEFLNAIGPVPHCFVTNNPIRSAASVAAHFVAIGLPRPEIGQIITSAQATAEWLAGEVPGFRYYAVGAAGLHEALAGVGVPDREHADFVVVGEGPGLDYEALQIGIELILGHGARLICTNPDTNVDATVDGRRAVLPGGGALVAPFAVATGVQPVFIGKPHPLLYRMALDRLGFAPADCLMIGDRPDTDIAGAQSLGMGTALVRTGRFAPGEPLPSGVRPQWDCPDLASLLKAWREAGESPC